MKKLVALFVCLFVLSFVQPTANAACGRWFPGKRVAIGAARLASAPVRIRRHRIANGKWVLGRGAARAWRARRIRPVQWALRR